MEHTVLVHGQMVDPSGAHIITNIQLISMVPMQQDCLVAAVSWTYMQATWNQIPFPYSKILVITYVDNSACVIIVK